ncbi:hypothetical protein AB205_0096300 [Aquarana catesbeiana]|uniref:Uncharacterized protein n=1 Tax=Aquarana catesbeiana TaxID=8400 RepID=A0A2G9RJT0_AQUCT|nr:hypothetical protein AB205_0096300 [Aquarana catesbeiana]
MRKWKSPKANRRRRRRRETWWKLSPQQVIVMLWMKVISPGESAQILIGEMGCNRDLENIKQNTNEVQNKMKNIIDVLGRV